MSEGMRPRKRKGCTLSVFAALLFVLGASVGLVLTWVVWPVEYYDTDPVDLRSELKQNYLLLIAASFDVEDDLDHARQRLGWLGLDDEGASRALVGLTHRHAGTEGGIATLRGLSKLAYALGARESQILVYVVTPTPTVTATPTSTATPTITMTPTDTPLAPTLVPAIIGTPEKTSTSAPATSTPIATSTPLPAYRLADKSFVCREVPGLDEGRGLLEIEVEDADGGPQDGEALYVVWDDSEDVFFTGLKPHEGLGYADFEMQPDIEYVIAVNRDESEPVTISFRDGECEDDTAERALAVWRVAFRERKMTR